MRTYARRARTRRYAARRALALHARARAPFFVRGRRRRRQAAWTHASIFLRVTSSPRAYAFTFSALSSRKKNRTPFAVRCLYNACHHIHMANSWYSDMATPELYCYPITCETYSHLPPYATACCRRLLAAAHIRAHVPFCWWPSPVLYLCRCYASLLPALTLCHHFIFPTTWRATNPNSSPLLAASCITRRQVG